MKKLLDYTEFFGKLNERVSYQLFNNESKLKELLVKNQDFAKGEVMDGITDILYSKYRENNKWGYSEFLNWIKNEYGTLPYFTTLLSNYNGQVCNGGHVQYFDNGYASINTHGFSSEHKDIDLHEDFSGLFYDLELNKLLKNGKEAFDIIESFDLELEDEIEDCSECGGHGVIDCDECSGTGWLQCSVCNGSGEDDGEDCSECGGDGQIDCDECQGSVENKCSECGGQGDIETGHKIPATDIWGTLDDRWYEIYDKLMISYNNYLKTLLLDGEKISDLVEYAKSTQNYNI